MAALNSFGSFQSGQSTMPQGSGFASAFAAPRGSAFGGATLGGFGAPAASGFGAKPQSAFGAPQVSAFSGASQSVLGAQGLSVFDGSQKPVFQSPPTSGPGATPQGSEFTSAFPISEGSPFKDVVRAPAASGFGTKTEGPFAAQQKPASGGSLPGGFGAPAPPGPVAKAPSAFADAHSSNFAPPPHHDPFSGYAQGTRTGRTLISASQEHGALIYQGPKGGLFFISKNGNKIYLKDTDRTTDPVAPPTPAFERSAAPVPPTAAPVEASSTTAAPSTAASTTATATPPTSTDTGSKLVSGGKYNGAVIYQGRRGGYYYLITGTGTGTGTSTGGGKKVYVYDGTSTAPQLALPPAPESAPGIPTGTTLISSGKYGGAPVLLGPKGGRYYANEKGEKVYLTEADKTTEPIGPDAAAALAAMEAIKAAAGLPGTPTGRTLISSGKYNGAEVFQGPKGSLFYLSESASKFYLKDTDKTTDPVPAAAKAEEEGEGRAAVKAAVTKEAAPAAAAATATASTSSTRSSDEEGSGDAATTARTLPEEGKYKGAGIFEGPSGGLYYLNGSGQKVYVQDGDVSTPAAATATTTATATAAPSGATITGRKYVSTGKYNNAEVFKGPKGGLFYLNVNGNKVYLKDTDKTVDV